MCAALCAAASSAHAQPDDDDVDTEVIETASTTDTDAALMAYRAAIDRGTTAFRADRFIEAREAFTRAFAIHPDPVLQFNIASCWRRSGDATEAIAAYRAFLSLASANDPRRSLALETIDDLTPDAATPIVPMPVIAPPRNHLRSSPNRSRLRPAGMAIAAAGVLGLIASAIEAGRARSIQNDLESLDRPRWDNHLADQYRRGDSASHRALILGISGAVITASGLTLYYIGRRSDRELRLSARAGVNRGELIVSGRF